MIMPSVEEQRIAEDYVLNHDLYRPNTDIKKALKYIGIFILISVFSAVISFFLFDRFGIFALISDSLIQFQSEHEKLFLVLYGVIFIILAGIIVLKKAIIGAIRLYQHYAPEDIRRRCLFKPTCSEYAILAVQKYGVVIGLIKAYKRLFKRCRGNIYMIDYP